MELREGHKYRIIDLHPSDAHYTKRAARGYEDMVVAATRDVHGPDEDGYYSGWFVKPDGHSRTCFAKVGLEPIDTEE